MATSMSTSATTPSTTTERDPLLHEANYRDFHGTPDGPAPPPPEEQSHRLGPLEISRSNRYGILAGVWAATFLSSLNTTLVATLLASISSEFKRSNQAGWLGTSYLLATCTFTPLYGRLCNVMGRRGANRAAVLFCAFGTLACGLSQNMPMLIISRFLSGLGGGGINTTSTIIMSDMYSMRSRGLTQGVANIFNGLGMGLGGPIGGYISDRFGWRWAFLMQMPLFALSLALTSYNLNYITPGKGKSARDVLKRIDYAGTFLLLLSVLSILTFLSNKFNDGQSWSSLSVYLPLSLAFIFSLAFVYVELRIAPEPVLAPFLLKQKIPVLIGIQNFLVANCNFAVMYFFPMWFMTVGLTSSSMAGLHLLPNSISMSCGSLFAGYMMHRTGKYKLINLIFGIFPFIAAVSITLLRADSGRFQMWFSIIPLGFGNAVVLQTTLIALLAHIPHSVMAVGTGFGQLFRGMGQVGGVGIASAIFQSSLDRELRKRIQGPGSEHIIRQIRHSSRLVATLPPDLQSAARDSYAISLRAVFIFASCATLAAYIIRLPIPEKSLDEPDRIRPARKLDGEAQLDQEERSEPVAESLLNDDNNKTYGSVAVRSVETRSDLEEANSFIDEDIPTPTQRRRITPMRRLSTYQSDDGGLDLEDEYVGGSARSF